MTGLDMGLRGEGSEANIRNKVHAASFVKHITLQKSIRQDLTLEHQGGGNTHPSTAAREIHSVGLTALMVSVSLHRGTQEAPIIKEIMQENFTSCRDISRAGIWNI